MKCSLGSPIKSGVPATAAEMTMSIRWTGASAPSSDVISPKNGDCVAYIRVQRGS